MTARNSPVHHCHAIKCFVSCKPEFLMCGRHWRIVPRSVQAKVYAAYRHGQCEDMSVSLAWLTAAKEAILLVALHEMIPEARINRDMADWDEFGRVVEAK